MSGKREESLVRPSGDELVRLRALDRCLQDPSLDYQHAVAESILIAAGAVSRRGVAYCHYTLATSCRRRIFCELCGMGDGESAKWPHTKHWVEFLRAHIHADGAEALSLAVRAYPAVAYKLWGIRQ
jgi:hypothetical protein